MVVVVVGWLVGWLGGWVVVRAGGSGHVVLTWWRVGLRTSLNGGLLQGRQTRHLICVISDWERQIFSHPGQISLATKKPA